MSAYLIAFSLLTAFASGATPKTFVCPEIFGLYPVEGSCRDFYQCAYGEAFRQTCPNNLHFNAERQICDYPHAVNCKEGTPTVRPPPTVAPQTPVPTSPPTLPLFTCPEPTGIFLSSVSCRVFYVCLDNVAYKTVCEPGYMYNPELRACDHEENVDCPIKPPTVGPPTAAPPTTPAPIVPPTLPPTSSPGFTCPQPDGIFPSPSSCRQFYNCINNIAHLNTCESSFLFNPEKGYCDYSHNVNCQRSQVHRCS